MKTSWKYLILAGALALAGCTTEAAKCTPQSCANGCCSESGACVTTQTTAACGLNGGACLACSGAQQCTSGQCQATTAGGDGGSDAGSTGGGAGGDGGSGGGGGTVPADAGTPADDAGTPTDAGAVEDAGTSVDAGVTCATTPHDAVLGTLTLANGATVAASDALPAGVVAVGAVGSTLYGLHTDRSVHPLGTLGALALGPPLARVTTDADGPSTNVFLGSSLAVSGTRLAAGYTKAGAGFPGSVAVIETTDAGVQYFDAPGNFTLAGTPTGFLVNGTALGSATGAGVYALDDQGPFGLASFDAAWTASSGYTARTGNGVLLLGAFYGTDFQNHVHAAPPFLTAPALTNRTAFSLAQAPDLISGGDLADVTALGDDALVVRGGYLSVPPYSAFTTRVERVPLTLSGSGVQTVTAGAPVTLVNAPDTCTRVLFAVGEGSTALLGVEDRNGRRLLRLQP